MNGQEASSFRKFQSLLASQIEQAQHKDEGQEKEEEMEGKKQFNNNKRCQLDKPHPVTIAETIDGKSDNDVETYYMMQPLKNDNTTKDLVALEQSQEKKKENDDLRRCMLRPQTANPEYADSKTTPQKYVLLPLTGTSAELYSNSVSHLKFNSTLSTDERTHAMMKSPNPPMGLGCKTGDTVRIFEHTQKKKRIDIKPDCAIFTTNKINVTNWMDQTDNCCTFFNCDGELFTVCNEKCNENQIVKFGKVREINNFALTSKHNLFCKNKPNSDTARLQNTDKDCSSFDIFVQFISPRDRFKVFNTLQVMPKQKACCLGDGAVGIDRFFYDKVLQKLSSNYHQTYKGDQMDASTLTVAKRKSGLFMAASFSDTADVDKNRTIIETRGFTAELVDKKLETYKIMDDINTSPKSNTWQKTTSKCSRVVVYQNEIQAQGQFNVNRVYIDMSPSVSELLDNTTNVINDSQHVRYLADCYCCIIQEHLSKEAIHYISQRCHRNFQKNDMTKYMYGSAFEHNHKRVSRKTQHKGKLRLTVSDRLSQIVETHSNSISKHQEQQEDVDDRQLSVQLNDTWHKTNYGMIDNLECGFREKERQDMWNEQCAMQDRVKGHNICQNEDFDYECDFHISRLLMPASVSSHMSIQEELRIAEQLVNMAQDKDKKMSALYRTQTSCICPKTINSNVCMKTSSSTVVNNETSSLCCHSLRRSSSDTCLYLSVSHSECMEGAFAGTNCVEDITRKNKEIIGCSDIFQSSEQTTLYKLHEKEPLPLPMLLLNNECHTERSSVLDSCSCQPDFNTVNLSHHFLGCFLTLNNNSLDSPEKGSDSGYKTNQVNNDIKSKVKNRSIKPQHYCPGSSQCQLYIGSPERDDSNDYLIEYSYSEGKSPTPRQKTCLLPCTVHKNRSCGDWLNKTNSNTLSTKSDCSEANEHPYLEASMMTAGSGHSKECKCLDYECLRQRGKILHDHVMRNLHVLKQFAAGGPKKRNFSVKIREAVGKKAKTLIERQKTVGRKSNSCPPVGRLLIPQTRPMSAKTNDQLSQAETFSRQQALASADSGIDSVPRHISDQYKMRSTSERNKTPNVHKSSSSKTLTCCLRSISAKKNSTSKSKSANIFPNVKEQGCLSKDENLFIPKDITKHVCSCREAIAVPSRSYEDLLETMYHDAALINDSAKCNKISSHDRLDRYKHRNQNANTVSMSEEQRDERLARSQRIVNQALDRLCALHQTDQECQRLIEQLKSNWMLASKSSGHNCDLIISPSNTKKKNSLSNTSKLDTFGEVSKGFVAPLDKGSAYFFSIEVPQSRTRENCVAKSRYNLQNQFRSDTVGSETRQILAKTGTNVTRELERRHFNPKSNQTTAYYYSLSKELESTTSDFVHSTDNTTSHVPYKRHSEENMSRSDEAIMSAAKSECQTGNFLNVDHSSRPTEAKHNKSFKKKSETVQNVKCPSGISISDHVIGCSFCRLDKDPTIKCNVCLSVSKENVICTDCAMKLDRKTCYVCSCDHFKQSNVQNNGPDDNKIFLCESTHAHSPHCCLINANDETSKISGMISDAAVVTEGTQTLPLINSNTVPDVDNSATNSDLTTEIQYDSSTDFINHKKTNSSPTCLMSDVKRHQFASKNSYTKTSLPSLLTSGKRDISLAKSVCKKKESKSTNSNFARPNSPALSTLSKASRGFTLPSRSTSELCDFQDANISPSSSPSANLYRVSLPPSDVEDQTPASVSSASHSRFSAQSSTMDSSTSQSGTIPFFYSKSSSRSSPTIKQSLNDSRYEVHQSISTGINPHLIPVGKSLTRTKTCFSSSIDGALPKNTNSDKTSPHLLTQDVYVSKHRCTSQNISPYSSRSSLGSHVKENVNSGSSIHSKGNTYSLSSKSKQSPYQQSSSDKLRTQCSNPFSRIKSQGSVNNVRTSSQTPSYSICSSSSTIIPQKISLAASKTKLTPSPTTFKLRSPDFSTFSSRGDNTFVEQQSQTNTPFTEIMPSYDFFGTTPRNRLLFPSHSAKHRQRSHSPGRNRTVHSESSVNVMSTPFTSTKIKIPSFGEVCIEDSSETFQSIASSISNTKEPLEKSLYNLTSTENITSDKKVIPSLSSFQQKEAPPNVKEALESKIRGHVTLNENQTVLPQLPVPEKSTFGSISSFIKQFIFGSEKVNNNQNHDAWQQHTTSEISQSTSKVNNSENVEPANNGYLSDASNLLKSLNVSKIHRCNNDQSRTSLNDGAIRSSQEKSGTLILKSDYRLPKSSLMHECHGNSVTGAVTVVVGDRCSSAATSPSRFSQKQKCFSNPVTKFQTSSYSSLQKYRINTSQPSSTQPSCKGGKTPIKVMCDYSHSSAPPSALSPAKDNEKNHRSLHLSDFEISRIRPSVMSQCSICKKNIKTFRCSCSCKHLQSMDSTPTSVPRSTYPERQPLLLRLKDIMRQGMGMMCNSVKWFCSLSQAVDPATLPPKAKRTYLITLLILMTMTGYFCGCYNCIEVFLLHSSSDLERFMEDFESSFDLRHVNLPPV